MAAAFLGFEEDSMVAYGLSTFMAAFDSLKSIVEHVSSSVMYRIYQPHARERLLLLSDPKGCSILVQPLQFKREKENARTKHTGS